MKRAPIHSLRVTRDNRAAVIEAAWAVAQLHARWGYAEISAGVNITLEQATTIVRAWLRDGAIEVLEEVGTSNRRLFRIKPGFELVIKRTRSAEENMWTAMRRLRSFTPTDLAAHATTDAVTVEIARAQDYCRVLLGAGFLRVARKAQPSTGREAIYSLARETGPRPPVERRVRAVVDPNTDEVHLIGGAA